MKQGFHKRQRLAGIVEKAGLTVSIAAWADIIVIHRVSLLLDIVGISLGLIFLAVSVIITPDE